MTLLNGWPYCNASEGVRYYLSYMPSFEHMFIKGIGISLHYDEWIIHLLALIPAINRERQTINDIQPLERLQCSKHHEFDVYDYRPTTTL